ncbi:GNAT family N-acetyltransferase [Streptomyces sp. NPDC048639]|uniref:GNAT family N-acetyltransferase n=1 Tax=Streptomyces sp. NPDC048639 TaxID=3365581 RepID=UPI0037180E57
MTARLVLHAMSPGEAERVIAGEPGSTDRWAAGYPAEGDVAGAARFLDVCARTGKPQPFGAYEIRRRDDGRAIGGLGFHGPADHSGSVTIGYGLIPAAQGKGYASEALRALLTSVRTHGITRVRGDTDRGNVASQRVMTAVGMRSVAEDANLKYYEIACTDGAVQPTTPFLGTVRDETYSATPGRLPHADDRGRRM